jgi:hypothetical protein
MKLFTPHIDKLKVFLKGASDEYTNAGGGSRIFVSEAFKATSLNWRYYRDELFDRKESNENYVKLYNEPKLENRKPLVYVQKDIDATYSLHKSFVVRHKTRLQIYRDDFANKAHRLPSSINSTLGVVDATNERIQGAQ